MDRPRENAKEKRAKIAELEQLASELLGLKKHRRLRRPLCIEFCGSPKAGKSTTISSLNLFLRRNDFKIAVLQERAGVCPIENKTHPYFNIWTMSSLIAEMLGTLEKGKDKVDIVIADRGIFDALCWFKWQNENPARNNPFLSDEVYRNLHSYILSDIWKKTIDVVYVFKVDPETSIQREYANLLTEKRGSVMREDILASYNKAIDQVVEETKENFRQVVEIKTDEGPMRTSPNLVNYEVTKRVLTNLRSLLDEKIAFLSKKDIKEPISKEGLEHAAIAFANRTEVERNDDYLQPIAVAVIADPQRKKVFCVKKSSRATSRNSPERGRLLLYMGGHVRTEDDDRHQFFPTIKKALHRELEEETGESLYVSDKNPLIIFKPNTEKSRKHVAICYVIEMDLEERTFKLNSEELSSKSGRVMNATDLVNENLEDWSAEILHRVFGLRCNHEQPELFSDSYFR